MGNFQGFLTLVMMVLIAYLTVGFYTILPYWLVVSAIESVNLFITLLYSLGLGVWLVVVLSTIIGFGNQGK